MKIFSLIVLTAVLAFAPGCAHVSVNDPQTGNHVVSAWLPAWPWQDVSQSVAKMSVTSSTNKFTTSLSGLGTDTATSTNATQMLGDLVGAAVGATVKAMLPVKP